MAMNQVVDLNSKIGGEGSDKKVATSKDCKAAKDVKAGAVIYSGHEEAIKQALELMAKFGLPLGLLPLEDVIEMGYVESTGYMWITQKKRVEHTFKLISKQVSFAEEIKLFIEKERIRKLTGVKAKELFLWPPVGDISVVGEQVFFKSFAGITKTFAVQAFAAGE